MLLRQRTIRVNMVVPRMESPSKRSTWYLSTMIMIMLVYGERQVMVVVVIVSYKES